MIKRFFLVLILVTATLTLAQNSPVGYTDPPMPPKLPYPAPDPARPHPAVVTPSAQPGGAPSDAIVLFDGKDLSQWSQRGPNAEVGGSTRPGRAGASEAGGERG